MVEKTEFESIIKMLKNFFGHENFIICPVSNNEINAIVIADKFILTEFEKTTDLKVVEIEVEAENDKVIISLLLRKGDINE